jgi:hypothetical protein
MMKHRLSVVAVMLSFCSPVTPVLASDLTPGEAPVVTPQGVVAASTESSVTETVQRWQLLIRRSFSSRVQEQRPATLTYETAGEGRNNYHIDLAVGRYYKNGNLNVSPSIEWHRRSLDSVDRNRVSAALTTDWTLKAASFTPLLRGRVDVGRDVANSITTSTASLLASGFLPDGDATGSTVKYHGIYKGTFYPYAGLEYFHNQPVGDLVSVNTTMALVMVEAKFVPLNHATKGVDSALEINGSYAFRKPISDEGLRSRYGLLKLDLNLYLDAMHHVALGFEYQNGQDPDAHLASAHSGLVAVRFKL